MEKEYSAIRNELKTGDIVLFSGKGAFSDIIKLVSFSKWSHVGMILNFSEYDFITIWESTTLSNIKDLTSGKSRKGVQLVPLSSRVQKYGGDMSVRQLKGGVLPLNSVSKLMKLRSELRGKKYEQSKVELIKSAYDGPFGRNHEDLSSVFCSELVAEAYQSLGLLTEKKPSNEYTPEDFSEKKMKALKGSFYLSKEITIKVG